jgi:hypothetical protein
MSSLCPGISNNNIKLNGPSRRCTHPSYFIFLLSSISEVECSMGTRKFTRLFVV